MKNKIALILTYLTIAIGVSACQDFGVSSNKNPSPTTNTTTTVKQVRMGSFSVAVDYAPYLVAKNKGWFDEAFKKKGISVDYTIFQSLAPINESLATNRVDVVFEAEPPAIIGKAAGINVKIVDISSTLTQEILVHSDSGIKTAADLKGKRIAVLAGTSSHYGLLKILGANGLKPTDIQVIDMIPPDAKNAFDTKQVDAWAVWPPFVEQEEISGTGRVLTQGDAVINSIMAVRGEFAQDNPELVKELVAVLQRSKNWIENNPTEAQKIVSNEINVPLDVVQKAWSKHDWSAQLTPAVINDIQAKADFLKSNNFIKNSVDVKDSLIDLSFSGTQNQTPATLNKPVTPNKSGQKVPAQPNLQPAY